MFKVLTDESPKGYKKKNEDRAIKIMDKYAQLERFHHDLWLQFYMYDFMYGDNQKVPVGNHFTSTKHFLWNTRKSELQDQSQNIGVKIPENHYAIIAMIA